MSKRTATAEVDALVAEDAGSRELTADQLNRITATANTLKTTRRRLEELEAQVASTKAEVLRLETQVLPGLMDEAGVEELVLSGGDKITRYEEVYASISKEKSGAACDWLEKNKFGALVKSSFVVPLPKGDTKTASAVRALLAKARVAFEETRGVHPQTLKAFVKESIAAGRSLPDTISVHLQPAIKLKTKE